MRCMKKELHPLTLWITWNKIKFWLVGWLVGQLSFVSMYNKIYASGKKKYRIGFTGTSWSSKKGTAKSCTWGTTPDTSIYWRLHGWKGWKDLGILMGTKLNMSHQSVLLSKAAKCTIACIRKSIVSTAREVIPPLYLALIRPNLKCYVPESSVKQRHYLWRTMKIIKSLEHFSYEKHLETWDFSSWK